MTDKKTTKVEGNALQSQVNKENAAPNTRSGATKRQV